MIEGWLQSPLFYITYSMDEAENEYLQKNIYKGLRNLNNGFDAYTIYYFSEIDFEIVLNRVEKLGIGIHGIEPWINGHYFDVKGCGEYELESRNPKWYRKAFEEFKLTNEELLYAASYDLSYLQNKE